MSKAKEFLNLFEKETLWDLFVTKGGKKEKVNKKPMTKSELEDMMKDYRKSGIKHDSLDSEPTK